MKRLWQRFLRLCRASEIRLSVCDLRLDAIRCGDLLQIGPRLFRVARRTPDPEGLELETAEQQERRAARARLRLSGSDPLLPWVFEERGVETRFASCDLLHFPVAAAR